MTTPNTSHDKTKKIILMIIAFLPLFIFFAFVGVIQQNEAFHNFVDKKNLLHIPNFHNVITNIAFTIAAIVGLIDYFRKETNYSISWLLFFFGVFLVAPGSAYYHYNPNSVTLVWDRIPMTIAFMALTSAGFSEIFKIKKEGLLCFTLITIGVLSVLYWKYFGDLRFYYWVQLTPILTLSFMAFAFSVNGLKRKNLLLAVLFYGSAMACEKLDYQIFALLSYSGHSIKHILASFAVLSLALMNYKKGNILKEE